MRRSTAIAILILCFVALGAAPSVGAQPGGPSVGGAMNYLARNDMTRGFAMLAFPADYANSGIMTFIVGPDGVVHQADLGEDTAAVASAITEFNPDDSWSPAE